MQIKHRPLNDFLDIGRLDELVARLGHDVVVFDGLIDSGQRVLIAHK